MTALWTLLGAGALFDVDTEMVQGIFYKAFEQVAIEE
jgi:hypothetical protein